jgi:uncharacterized protein
MIGRLIHKYSFPILALTLLVSAFSVYLFPRLKTDVGFGQFAIAGNPEYIRYQKFVSQMGSPDELFVLAIKGNPTIFNLLVLQKLQALKRAINSMAGVEETFCLLDLQKYKALLPGYFQNRPYLQASHPERFLHDSELVFHDYPVTQFFLTPGATWTKLYFKVHKNLSLTAIDSLTKKIDVTSRRLGLTNTHLAGRKYMESEFRKLVNNELKTSLVLSILFVMLMLAILHRSVAGVIIPLGCMAVSLLMLYGYMALFNRPLTIMSSLFPTLILIIGISDVMHISSKYTYESMQTRNRIVALNNTLKEIGLTTFINSLTTAVGFLTMITMSMAAMRSFGIDAAIGLLIAWLNSVLLLPALLSRFNLARSFSKPYNSKIWSGFLHHVNRITANSPAIIIGIFILLVAISIPGILSINTNNYVLTSLPDHNRLKEDFSFFDKQLGEGRTLEMIIEPRKLNEVYDQPVINNTNNLENYLQRQMKVTQILSPVLPVRWLHNIMENTWDLTASTDRNDQYKDYLTSKEVKLPVRIVNSSGTIGRLTGKMKDPGRKTVEKELAALRTWINRNIDTSTVQYHITGTDYFTDIGHQERIDNMVSSFIQELLVVALIIGLIYRSILLVLVTFIVNIIPILLVSGFMGYFGIELRGTTTIIFAIGYVIAVDDTLHFINRFQLEKRKGLDTPAAVTNTLLHTGRAMVMTSIILLGGFLVLLHSSFGDVFYHGLLVSLIILTASISELMLTPVLIALFFRDKQLKTGTTRMPLIKIQTNETPNYYSR